MSKILKHIDVELTASSINRAIREIELMKKQLNEQLLDLVRELTQEGIEIAKMQVVALDAIMTGDLEKSIQGVFFKEEGCGVIYSDVPHALYVEFGTGIVGDTTFHDLSGADGSTHWDYDVRGHGTKGWWYPAPWGWWIPKTGKYKGQPMAWTQGMPARPFLYNTLRWLQESAPDKASSMFNQM